MNKKEFSDMLRSSIYSLARSFVDSLKSDTHKQALDTVEDLEKMSQQEFKALVAERISVLDDFEQKEALKAIEKIKSEWNAEIEKGLSLRETILLNIQSMIKSHNYSKQHQSKVDVVDLDGLSSTDFKICDLNAVETLFLWYLSSHKITTEQLNIPGYWTHTYHLDYQAALEKLISSGYLRLSNTKESINLYNLPDIKEFLKKKSLPVTGKKQLLIDRICENCSEDEIRCSFPNKTFKATPSGEQIISQNEYLIYFHQNMNQFNISIEEAEKAHKENQSLNQYELALFFLNNRSNESLEKKSYGSYRNTLYCKSIVYKDMECFETELYYLIQTAFFDFKEFHNNNEISSVIAPGIIFNIKTNPHYISCTPESFCALFNKCVTELPVPTCEEMIAESFTTLKFELEKDAQ